MKHHHYLTLALSLFLFIISFSYAFDRVEIKMDVPYNLGTESSMFQLVEHCAPSTSIARQGEEDCETYIETPYGTTIYSTPINPCRVRANVEFVDFFSVEGKDGPEVYFITTESIYKYKADTDINLKYRFVKFTTLFEEIELSEKPRSYHWNITKKFETSLGNFYARSPAGTFQGLIYYKRNEDSSVRWIFARYYLLDIHNRDLKNMTVLENGIIQLTIDRILGFDDLILYFDPEQEKIADNEEELLEKEEEK